MEKGEVIGIKKGSMEKAEETAKNLLALNMLTSEQIAQATGLTLRDVAALRESSPKHGNA